MMMMIVVRRVVVVMDVICIRSMTIGMSMISITTTTGLLPALLIQKEVERDGGMISLLPPQGIVVVSLIVMIEHVRRHVLPRTVLPKA